jgi:hypothetical protein
LGNSKIISAIWRFSGVNGVCQSGPNNKKGSPMAVERMIYTNRVAKTQIVK